MPSHADLEVRRVFARCFAENLLRARRAAGLSQEALGFEAMLHRTEIGTLERGERVPGLDTAVKLAAALGVSVDQLVAGIAWRVREPAGGRFDAREPTDSQAG
jgi:transcriptional regulator with XRE-family HTH domain